MGHRYHSSSREIERRRHARATRAISAGELSRGPVGQPVESQVCQWPSYYPTSAAAAAAADSRGRSLSSSRSSLSLLLTPVSSPSRSVWLLLLLAPFSPPYSRVDSFLFPFFFAACFRRNSCRFTKLSTCTRSCLELVIYRRGGEDGTFREFFDRMDI